MTSKTLSSQRHSQRQRLRSDGLSNLSIIGENCILSLQGVPFCHQLRDEKYRSFEKLVASECDKRLAAHSASNYKDYSPFSTVVIMQRVSLILGNIIFSRKCKKSKMKMSTKNSGLACMFIRLYS